MERNLGSLSENQLYDAAATGDERSLQELLEQDPLLLNRVSYTCSNKTPLHVATIHGHLPFVRAILALNPDLAQELDSHQSSPLHVASSKGHLEIARELLSAAPGMCLSRDFQGRNPLHLAAIKGHLGVMIELVRLAPAAARVKLDRGMTVLHLCVEYNQLEALKVLVVNFDEQVNEKDDDGNTVLHTAVRDRQIETVNFLLTVASLEVNGLNLNGMTALDLLIRSTRKVRDSEMEETLKRAGSFAAIEAKMRGQASSPDHLNRKQKNTLENLLGQHDDWLEKKRGALMVVASLIATMAFQVGVNPPGGVWQEDNLVSSQGNSDLNHRAGFSILARNYPGRYKLIYILNTISFIASLNIILLLMSGLPLRRRLFMWILMVITWIAITTLAYTYNILVIVLTPFEQQKVYERVMGYSITVWACVMAILLVGHSIRLILMVREKSRSKQIAGSAEVSVNINVGV